MLLEPSLTRLRDVRTFVDDHTKGLVLVPRLDDVVRRLYLQSMRLDEVLHVVESAHCTYTLYLQLQ